MIKISVSLYCDRKHYNNLFNYSQRVDLKIKSCFVLVFSPFLQKRQMKIKCRNQKEWSGGPAAKPQRKLENAISEEITCDC